MNKMSKNLLVFITSSSLMVISTVFYFMAITPKYKQEKHLEAKVSMLQRNITADRKIIAELNKETKLSIVPIAKNMEDISISVGNIIETLSNYGLKSRIISIQNNGYILTIGFNLMNAKKSLDNVLQALQNAMKSSKFRMRVEKISLDGDGNSLVSGKFTIRFDDGSRS
ncbi:MAG: hypothetical protein D6732_22080 [Methanobacteriota archaeon]|nr:MAG: hypothetical protein D6732_22080 [Euryarchaeota archaeon]